MDTDQLVKLAFAKACQFLREHPPNDTCEHMELVQLVYDAKSDPKGYRWAAYFIKQVLEEIEEE